MDMFQVKKLEDCFGASQVYQYWLKCGADETFLEMLGTLGELKCKRNMRRPFFKLTRPDGTEVKGVIGDDIIKASFPDGTEAQNRAAFESELERLVRECIQKGERNEQ